MKIQWTSTPNGLTKSYSNEATGITIIKPFVFGPWVVLIPGSAREEYGDFASAKRSANTRVREIIAAR